MISSGIVDVARRSYNTVIDHATDLSSIALFATMALVTGSSVSRYLFNAPVQETRPVSVLYLLTAIVFLAVPRLQSRENNINVFFLYERVSSWKQNLFDLIGRVFGLMFIPIICYISLSETYNAYQTDWYTTGAVEVPMFLSFALMALGMTILTIVLVTQFMNDVKKLISEA